MKDKPDFLYPLFGFLALIVLGGGVVVGYNMLFNNQSNPATSSEKQAGQTVNITIKDDDHTKGNGDVVVVEYVDLQCPACRQMYPFIQKLVQEHGDKITLVTRHFPLGMHPNAMEASFAAEAAATVGGEEGFWAMKDTLFKNQKRWANVQDPLSKFKKYAKTIGIDADEFVEAYNSEAVRTDVRAEKQNGRMKAGVRYTPYILVNGQEFRPKSYDDFVRRIEQASPTQ